MKKRQSLPDLHAAYRARHPLVLRSRRARRGVLDAASLVALAPAVAGLAIFAALAWHCATY
jgi:hypothetical protein